VVEVTNFLYDGILFAYAKLAVHISIFCVCRFLLVPKLVLVTEQEEKLRDGDNAISSLLVY
jgi:hypothetical protein